MGKLSRGRNWRATLALLLLFCCALPQAQAYDSASAIYTVRHDRWTEEDEAGYRNFIQAIGASDCSSLNECLRSAANPFRGTDRPGYVFEADCSDLPYVLRFYYAWKRGLPFSYVSKVEPRDGTSEDIRYARNGNKVTARADVPSGTLTGYAVIARIREAVSSATYRMHPGTDGPLSPDLFSPTIDAKSIQPGTIIYDPAGHVAVVFRVDPDGRVHSFDAHTDFSGIMAQTPLENLPSAA